VRRVKLPPSVVLGIHDDGIGCHRLGGRDHALHGVGKEELADARALRAFVTGELPDVTPLS
jgi:hypothetical protein